MKIHPHPHLHLHPHPQESPRTNGEKEVYKARLHFAAYIES